MGQVAVVELLQVFSHDESGLHQQATHPNGISLYFIGLFDHLGDPHLDANVVDLVAVVGEDDVHQVLPDVMHVPLDGGQHDATLAAIALHLLHMWLQVGHGLFHGLR